MGLWKAGKTTLISYLLRSFGTGGDIAGIIHPSKVLVVTEESKGLWARRRDEIGIGDNVSFVSRPFRGKPSMSQWLALVDFVATAVAGGRFQVVVLDPWQSLNPSRDENDAASTMAAVAPMQRITEAGAAVLLLHHPRKGDAAEGQAARGSGALAGFVDIIVELRRYCPENADDRRRKLQGLSRFDETPHEVVLDLRDSGYVLLGTKADADQRDRFHVTQTLLRDSEGRLTVEEILQRWPEGGVPKPGKRTISTDLQAGVAARQWNKDGTGHKGDPYRYYLNGNPIVRKSNDRATDDSIPAGSFP